MGDAFFLNISYLSVLGFCLGQIVLEGVCELGSPSGIISSSTGGISKSAMSGLLKTGSTISSEKGTSI